MILRKLGLLTLAAILAQLIALAALVFIARIYSPREFGLLATFTSIMLVLSVSSAMRYELAILLPERESEAEDITLLAIVIVFAFSGLSALVVVGFVLLYPNLQYPVYGTPMLGAIPLGILVIGLQQIYFNVANRCGQVRAMSSALVLQQLVAAIFQITWGAIIGGESGLIAGYLLGYFAATVTLTTNSKYYAAKRLLSWGLWPRLKKIAWQYRDQALFAAPFAIINAISLQIIVFVAIALYDDETVGQFALASRIYISPFALLASMFSVLFFRRLAETPSIRLYWQSFAANAIICTVLVLPLVIFAVPIFSATFGGKWVQAAEFGMVLAPLAIANAAESSVGHVYTVIQRNGIVLIWQLAYLAGALVIFYVCKSLPFATTIAWFAGFGTAMYLLLFAIGYFLLKQYCVNKRHES